MGPSADGGLCSWGPPDGPSADGPSVDGAPADGPSIDGASAHGAPAAGPRSWAALRAVGCMCSAGSGTGERPLHFCPCGAPTVVGGSQEQPGLRI